MLGVKLAVAATRRSDCSAISATLTSGHRGRRQSRRITASSSVSTSSSFRSRAAWRRPRGLDGSYVHRSHDWHRGRPMKRPPIDSFAGALGLALAMLAAFPAASRAAKKPKPQTLQIFAAASLSDAFTEIGHRLERQRPGLTVRISFAGSQQLAMQLEQGATADLFASADERWMSDAKKRGVLAGQPVVFARNRLVMIVPQTNPAHIERLQDL